MSEANKIYLLRGNDTPLSVCLRKREGDGDPVPYDLSEAERIRLALVGHGAHVFASGVTVSGEDNNIVSGVIPGRALLKGDYDLEVTFRSGGRDKRFAVEDMFEAVDFLAEDADGETEGEGAGIWVNVTVQPEVIEIAGPTGPKGDTPVLTANEDGTIYADGVLLTEVVKDVTEAVESAERSRVTAESQRVAAESARVSAEQGRATAETARQTAEGNRATAETERASAEGARITAERGRVSAESGRVSAESARVAAETARESASATAVQNAETATAAANTAAEHAEEAATTIDEKIEQKANKDGYYPEMSVGSLVGTEVTQVEGITAIAKSTGIAKINKVRGKTLVWNQLLRIKGAAGPWTSNGVTMVNNHDGSFTFNGTATAGGFINSTNRLTGISLLKTHKYFVFLSKVDIGLYLSPTAFDVTYISGNIRTAAIVSPNNDGDPYYRISVTAGETYNDTTVTPFIIDLTLMFGAGNEPSTVEEFEAQYPLSYYDYNAGTLVNNASTGLQTRDGDDNVVDTLPLNLTSLTGKLNGEGSSVTVFPEGLMSYNTYVDELQPNKGIRKNLAIDLGNLTWTKGLGKRFSATLPERGGYVSTIILPRANLLKYTKVVASTNFDNADNVYTFTSQTQILIGDSAYQSSSAEDFKAAMSGVMLQYVLATPQEYILDEPIYMCIKTEQGGVISQLPENGSEPTTAPMRMDITYALPPEALISGSSLENLLNALKTANKITNYTMTYNPTSGKWEFTIS